MNQRRELTERDVRMATIEHVVRALGRSMWESERGNRIVRVDEWPHVRRGIKGYAVGYQYSKMYSHHFNGLVHQRVLGWGVTLDGALLDAKARAAIQIEGSR